MLIPRSFRKAASKSKIQLCIFLITFVIWELVKDRLAEWANRKIDEKSGVVMDWLAPYIKGLAIAELGYTVAVAIIVMIAIYTHAYYKEAGSKITPHSKKINPGTSKSTVEDDFQYFAEIRETEDQPLLKPDITMSEAMEYLISLLFPDKPENIGNLDIENSPAANLLTQKLRAGNLRSWGLFVGESVEREFSTEEWKFRELDYVQASIPTKKKPQTKTVGAEEQFPLTGLRVNFNQLQTIFPKKYTARRFRVTSEVQDKLFLSVATVRTKVLSDEEYRLSYKKLTENLKYLYEHETVFEESEYRQEFRNFMHSAGIAHTKMKQYKDDDEKNYVLNLMRESSEKLEEALK